MSSDTIRDCCGKLRRDLERPAGGWTVGLVTYGFLFGSSLLSVLTVDLIWTIVAIFSFLAHLYWANHGYYPRRI
jgi:hypothetical protein